MSSTREGVRFQLLMMKVFVGNFASTPMLMPTAMSVEDGSPYPIRPSSPPYSPCPTGRTTRPMPDQYSQRQLPVARG